VRRFHVNVALALRKGDGAGNYGGNGEDTVGKSIMDHTQGTEYDRTEKEKGGDTQVM
jgi:hypothetical protein